MVREIGKSKGKFKWDSTKHTQSYAKIDLCGEIT